MKSKCNICPYNFYLSLISEWYGDEIIKNQDVSLNKFFNSKYAEFADFLSVITDPISLLYTLKNNYFIHL